MNKLTAVLAALGLASTTSLTQAQAPNPNQKQTPAANTQTGQPGSVGFLGQPGTVGFLGRPQNQPSTRGVESPPPSRGFLGAPGTRGYKDGSNTRETIPEPRTDLMQPDVNAAIRQKIDQIGDQAFERAMKRLGGSDKT